MCFFNEIIDGFVLPGRSRLIMPRKRVDERSGAGASRVEASETVPCAGEAPQCANGRFDTCK